MRVDARSTAGFSATSDLHAADSQRPKRVLIISTGSRLAPGFVRVDQQLLNAIGNIPSVPVDIYAENLDLVRFPSEQRLLENTLAFTGLVATARGIEVGDAGSLTIGILLRGFDWLFGNARVTNCSVLTMAGAL